MGVKNKLFTIRNWYENKSKTGIMLTASANVNGHFETVKIYVPFQSRYDTSPTAQLPIDPNDSAALINIPQHKTFEDDGEL